MWMEVCAAWTQANGSGDPLQGWDSRIPAETTLIHQQPLLGDTRVTLNGSVYKNEYYLQIHLP